MWWQKNFFEETFSFYWASGACLVTVAKPAFIMSVAPKAFPGENILFGGWPP